MNPSSVSTTETAIEGLRARITEDDIATTRFCALVDSSISAVRHLQADIDQATNLTLLIIPMKDAFRGVARKLERFRADTEVARRGAATLQLSVNDLDTTVREVEAILPNRRVALLRENLKCDQSKLDDIVRVITKQQRKLLAALSGEFAEPVTEEISRRSSDRATRSRSSRVSDGRPVVRLKVDIQVAFSHCFTTLDRAYEDPTTESILRAFGLFFEAVAAVFGLKEYLIELGLGGLQGQLDVVVDKMHHCRSRAKAASAAKKRKLRGLMQELRRATSRSSSQSIVFG